MTIGNGTPNTASATNAATAKPTRRLFAKARVPTRHTAWATIATTAGASPANRAVTTVVSPYPA